MPEPLRPEATLTDEALLLKERGAELPRRVPSKTRHAGDKTTNCASLKVFHIDIGYNERIGPFGALGQ